MCPISLGMALFVAFACGSVGVTLGFLMHSILSINKAED